MFNALSRRKLLMMTSGLVSGTNIAVLSSYTASPLKPNKITSKRLLVVDGNPNLLLLIGDYLEFLGYEVITAENGEEALEILEQDLPHLITSGIGGMSGMGGFAFLENIRRNKRTCSIPFMFLATTGGQHRIKGLSMGADAYITLPFDIEEVVAQVEVLLKQRFYQHYSREFPVTKLRCAITPMPLSFS